MSLIPPFFSGERRRADMAPTAEDGDAAVALRLIRGFEAQGAGWFWETDRDGRLTYLSPRVADRLVGVGEDAIGRSLVHIFEMAGGTDATERTLPFHLAARASFVDYEVRTIAGGDHRCWSISGRPWFDDIGRFRGFVGSGTDLTDKRRSEAEIARLAMFDSLTGLANRAHMRGSLAQLLTRRVGSYRPTALLLLDLDRFKAVNDTLGHQVGDQLLRQVAERLQRSVGATDLVGRIGGDEFQVVVPGVSDREALARLARTIIATLSQPYLLGGAHVTIGCSVGIAIAPEDGDDPETLIRNADLALYAAKGRGRGIHCFYRLDLLVEAQTRKMLEDDLRHALGRDELSLVYQPVVSTADARVVGYEALLRWQHPTRGAVSPADFIPIAEEAGLIGTIGEWVLRTACMTAASWPAPVRVAVNVSPVQFARPELPALVTSALAASGLAPDRLELEITESVFLDGSASTEQMFAGLKAIGVRLALDDFGTGYSSLGYLRTAPFDKIKIDQSFVRGAKVAGSRNAAIIRAITTLADALGLETTAEGVEAQDEIELIRSLGCSHIQGFVYGRPASAADVAASIADTARPAQPVGVRHTRAPRATMLRSTAIACGRAAGTARIRNVSTSGAMIDSIAGTTLTVGHAMTIEVMGEPRGAIVRWLRDGRAGLRFDEPIDLAAALVPTNRAA